ncbi:VOC family protein [Flavisphingomonas formosensis]|uniref:VOC family protein n=1 Tax=Flavisphingomonas formosensis TaxID=861534 RepID=UPI0012FB4835|nr:VOC family protein [Sphingomonas formosensis]
MTRLDHCNIRTLNLDATIGFYSDVLELKPSFFPGSSGQGAWLHDSTDRPVIHLVAIDPDDPAGSIAAIRGMRGGQDGDFDPSMLKGSGAIDHIAFECSDYDGMENRLQTLDLSYTSNNVESIGLRQLFVSDPNGITVELNFR